MVAKQRLLALTIDNQIKPTTAVIVPDHMSHCCRESSQPYGCYGTCWLVNMMAEPEHKRVQLLEWLLAQGVHIDLGSLNTKRENALHCAVVSQSSSVLKVGVLLQF